MHAHTHPQAHHGLSHLFITLSPLFLCLLTRSVSYSPVRQVPYSQGFTWGEPPLNNFFLLGSCLASVTCWRPCPLTQAPSWKAASILRWEVSDGPFVSARLEPLVHFVVWDVFVPLKVHASLYRLGQSLSDVLYQLKAVVTLQSSLQALLQHEKMKKLFSERASRVGINRDEIDKCVLWRKTSANC